MLQVGRSNLGEPLFNQQQQKYHPHRQQIEIRYAAPKVLPSTQTQLLLRKKCRYICFTSSIHFFLSLLQS